MIRKGTDRTLSKAKARRWRRRKRRGKLAPPEATALITHHGYYWRMDRPVTKGISRKHPQKPKWGMKD